jgi:SAM-dependent methyltransferase
MKKNKYVVDENKPHLGGNLIFGDVNTWSPSAWNYIIEKFKIKNMTDLGSGLGHTAKWFSEKLVDVTAVDGLVYNVKNSIYPTTLHDLTNVPFLKSVDLVYCVEVVEHIEEKYLDNLLTSLTQGDYLFMTHAIPGQEGWHHVNCQNEEYWINHLLDRNFILLKDDSEEIQKLANNDNAIHIARNGMIFKKSSSL